MARLDKINQFMTTTQPPAVGAQEAKGISGFSTASHKGPDKITYANSGIAPTVTSNQEYTNGALKQMNEGQFEAHKEQMNVSDKEYWRQQFEQHPESAYTLANMMLSSNETPFEKKKRERREQLGQIFSNLGNVIGNAANLYYTSKGAPYIDLNTHQKAENDRIQKIRDRRQALKDKMDMILFNARMGDMAAARQGKIAADKLAAYKAKAEADRASGLYKFNADMAYKKGKDAANEKRKDKEFSETQRHNKAMEAVSRANANNRSGNNNKVLDSALGKDGYIYTRNTKLSEIEAKQLIELAGVEDMSPFIVEEKDFNGNVTNRKVDWASAAAYALSKGDISGEELVARGFKRGNGSFNHNDYQDNSSKTAPYKKDKGNDKKTAPYLK